MRCSTIAVSCMFRGAAVALAVCVAAESAWADQPATSGEAAHGVEKPAALGLVSEKPSEGRFVKTDRGYMVPYEMTIPETDATFEMVPIPGGTFRMGSPTDEAERNANEGPCFTVRIEPFWMGKHEIAWGEYREYMKMLDLFAELDGAKKRVIPQSKDVDAVTIPSVPWRPQFTFQYGDDPRLPAVTMSQFAARQYTKWLSGLTGVVHRLPSEAEWEYASRAGTTTPWYFGDDPSKLGEHAWNFDNSEDTTHPVGKKKPNPWGLHDMYGNVQEWVLDQYDAGCYARFEGKEVAAKDSVLWPTKVAPRVLRGGSWFGTAKECRSAFRYDSRDGDWQTKDPNLPHSPWWYDNDETQEIGFRIIRPLDPPSPKELARCWNSDNKATRHAVTSALERGRGTTGIAGADLVEWMKRAAAKAAEAQSDAAPDDKP